MNGSPLSSASSSSSSSSSPGSPSSASTHLSPELWQQLQQVAEVLAAVQRAVEGRRRELRVIVEVFRQTAGAPIDTRPFAAEPASFERVRRQLGIARAFSSGLLAFTVPDYMNPDDTPAKAQLFERYRRACVEDDC